MPEVAYFYSATLACFYSALDSLSAEVIVSEIAVLIWIASLQTENCSVGQASAWNEESGGDRRSTKMKKGAPWLKPP